MKNLILISACAFSLLASCNMFSTGGGDDGGESGESFADIVADLLPDFSGLETGEDTDGVPEEDGAASTEDPEADDPGYVVGYRVQRYRAGATFDSLAVLDPQTSVIYPGSVLSGASIPTGAYTQIVGGERLPATISVSLIGGDEVAAEIANPDRLSEVRSGINALLSQDGITGSLATAMTFESREVFSQEDLRLGVGANYKYDGVFSVDISSQFNYDSSDAVHEILLQFMQVYYTIDVDALAPGQFYAEAPDMSAYGEVCPVYVASVAYGRLAFMSISSTESTVSIKEALDAALEYGKHQGSIALDVESERVLRTCTIKSTIVGSDDSAAVLGYDAFLDFIASGSGFTAESPGSPVSYTLKYVRDNSIASVLLYSEYTVRQAIFRDGTDLSAAGVYRVTVDRYGLTTNSDPGSEGEIYGQIVGGVRDGADIPSGAADRYFFDRGDSNLLDIPQAVNASAFDSSGGTTFAVSYDFDLSAHPSDGNRVVFYGWVNEEDDWPNGDDGMALVGGTVSVPLSGASFPISGHLTFSGDGNDLLVHYKIEKIE